MLETDLSYPLVVEVTLFKHNLVDNRFLSEIRRNARITKVANSLKHFFVPVEDIKTILDLKFRDEVLYQNGLSEEDLVKHITSTFFLYSVINTFTSLKYIKFCISHKKNYTRRKGNQISFEYKILHAKIDLPSLVSSVEELSGIQRLLVAIKFWKPNKFYPKPFIEVASRDLITQINYYEGANPEFATEHNEAISALLRYIDMKLESDNSSLQVIVMN